MISDKELLDRTIEFIADFPAAVNGIIVTPKAAELFIKNEDDERHYVVISKRGHGKWAIVHAGCCLTKKGAWEYERFASNRTDKFKERARFDSVREAYDFFQVWRNKTIIKLMKNKSHVEITRNYFKRNDVEWDPKDENLTATEQTKILCHSCNNAIIDPSRSYRAGPDIVCETCYRRNLPDLSCFSG